MEFIKEYNVLNEEECAFIIDYFHKQNPLQGRVSSSSGRITKTNKLNALNVYVDETDFNNPIFKKVINSLRLYMDNHKYLPHMYSVQLGIKKYIKNEGYFKEHVDSNTVALSRRFVSFLVYLNDVQIGGETKFRVSDKEISISPTTGKLVVFPSFWMFPHEGAIPISNDKYVLVGHLSMLI